VTLKDSDTVPAAVTLADFRGQRSFYTRFTARENRVAMRMLKAFLLRPEIYARVEEMEREAQGNKGRHSLMLCELLGKEAYPPILRHFGFPDDEQPVQLTMDCMNTMHEDMEANTLWLETEVLMRNQAKIADAYENLARHHVAHGLPPPTLEVRT